MPHPQRTGIEKTLWNNLCLNRNTTNISAHLQKGMSYETCTIHPCNHILIYQCCKRSTKFWWSELFFRHQPNYNDAEGFCFNWEIPCSNGSKLHGISSLYQRDQPRDRFDPNRAYAFSNLSTAMRRNALLKFTDRSTPQCSPHIAGFLLPGIYWSKLLKRWVKKQTLRVPNFVRQSERLTSKSWEDWSYADHFHGRMAPLIRVDLTIYIRWDPLIGSPNNCSWNLIC